MKHYMKPTHEKSRVQIIFHIEIANEVVQLAKSAKTDKKKVAALSLVKW